MKKNKLSELLIKIISEQYQLIPEDSGEFSKFKCGMLNVTVNSYNAPEFGHISVLNGSALFGIMKMETIILNAIEKDSPLLSFDYIKIPGHCTLLLELYDTVIDKNTNFNSVLKKFNLIKSKIKDLPDYKLGNHWYDYMKFSESIAKRTKKSYSMQLYKTAEEYFSEYIKFTKNIKECSKKDEKKKKTFEYVDGLLTKGGPTTNAFKKKLGDSKTRLLFENVLFGLN